MLMAVIAGTCTVVYQSGSKNVPNEKEFVLNEGDSIDEAMKTEEKETTEENRNSETQNPESKDPETQDVNTSQVEGERVMEEETEEPEPEIKTIYGLGSAFGWDSGNPTGLTPDPDEEGIYTAEVNLIYSDENKQFKFCLEKGD